MSENVHNNSEKKKIDNQGHVAHTQAADSQRGLEGEMRGPIKLTMLGAGSGFTPRLVSDVVQIEGSVPATCSPDEPASSIRKWTGTARASTTWRGLPNCSTKDRTSILN